MADLQKFKDHFILLCEAGFIAVNQQDEDAATKLFKASSLLKPENNLAKIGQGYMHMMKLELNQACKLFDEVIAKDPKNDMAKAFLGLSYALTATDVAKGEQLLEDAAKSADDDQVKKLADTALDFVEKFVKKDPTPLEKPPEDKEK
ncbi:MAG: SctF chaperone SctG [Simkaniaceae bacterium]|nr:SctF chaperone SctG [Candidatus Sacchlamyda saccharinae]